VSELRLAKPALPRARLDLDSNRAVTFKALLRRRVCSASWPLPAISHPFLPWALCPLQGPSALAPLRPEPAGTFRRMSRGTLRSEQAGTQVPGSRSKLPEPRSSHLRLLCGEREIPFSTLTSARASPGFREDEPEGVCPSWKSWADLAAAHRCSSTRPKTLRLATAHCNLQRTDLHGGL
jgi:hypothetical protein